jgi:hypothetical protein
VPLLKAELLDAVRERHDVVGAAAMSVRAISDKIDLD